VPSASPQPTRLAALAICGLLLCGAAAGCSTTQEKAEIQQARSKHILDARAERQRKKHADEPKSAQRPQEGKQ
jgi:hypothetical protein